MSVIKNSTRLITHRRVNASKWVFWEKDMVSKCILGAQNGYVFLTLDF